MKNRVVVTGLGAVSPVGNSVAEFWEGLGQGRSGVDYLTRFDPRNCKCQIAAEVKGDLPPLHPALELANDEIVNRSTLLALVALSEALANSEVGLADLTTERAGVLVGGGLTFSNFHPLFDLLLSETTTGEGAFTPDKLRTAVHANPATWLPQLEPFTCGYHPAAAIASRLEMIGMNRTIYSACASGAQAIGEAFRQIAQGDLDIAITGGTDSMIDLEGFTFFTSLHVLSTESEEPTRASCPFDLRRNGFVLGEGAGMLILESLEHAQQRQAHIYGEISGYGCFTDTHHITAPNPTGEVAARTMGVALGEAGLSVADVGYICAQGTSTIVNDRMETAAVKLLFGDRAYQVPISSIKSMIGHTVAAAGPLNTIATLLAMRDSLLPPTINLETPDPACDLDYVPLLARQHEVGVAISNSFGFGGQNVSLVIKKW